MRKWLPIALVLVGPAFTLACAREAPLDAAARVMGAATLTSIQFSGSGSNFALGQSPNPDAPWPRFEVKSYTAVASYDPPAWRQEMVRVQGENPPRGGGGQPLIGEQRQVLVLSGDHAWNVAGQAANPAPAAVTERKLQLWMTPHGFVKAAMANNATVTPPAAGVGATTVSFDAPGVGTISGVINEQNQVEKVEARIDNPVLGDMVVETVYSDYRDFAGVMFPARIVQTQGGFPVLDVTVTDVQANAPADTTVPANVQEATAPAVTVEAQKVGDGVWYLTGGSHHSVAVEFKDHVVIVEAPLNEARSNAVLAEVKKLVPDKPIRAVINTHHHFDHSGGLRTYVAEGVTIVTHEINRPFFEKVFAAPRTLAPDRLAQAPRNATFEAVADQHVMTDGARTFELYHVQGNTHNEGILMGYLPRERILVEADVFNPPPPGAPPPSSPNPFSVNLVDNIQRLKLRVDAILPIHGRQVTMQDLLIAIGKASTN